MKLSLYRSFHNHAFPCVPPYMEVWEGRVQGETDLRGFPGHEGRHFNMKRANLVGGTLRVYDYFYTPIQFWLFPDCGFRCLCHLPDRKSKIQKIDQVNQPKSFVNAIGRFLFWPCRPGVQFHKGLELGVFQRDSSICLRPTPSPNFYTTKSFSKLGATFCAVRPTLWNRRFSTFFICVPPAYP